jgi:putative hemolysin
VELGRSFVRAEYQKSSNVLMLLWKGIAQFVVRSDRYRVLFGPVSISARYGDASRELLQAFLLQNARHRELAELVTALVPPARDVATGLTCPADVQQLDKLIAGFELDGKGIPVLLRQYLRLNAKLLAFNVDAAFGDALDALMMVDLADVDRAILTRYFGREGAVRVLDRSLSYAA